MYPRAEAAELAAAAAALATLLSHAGRHAAADLDSPLRAYVIKRLDALRD